MKKGRYLRRKEVKLYIRVRQTRTTPNKPAGAQVSRRPESGLLPQPFQPDLDHVHRLLRAVQSDWLRMKRNTGFSPRVSGRSINVLRCN